MTGRDRLLAVYHRRPVDRLPWVPLADATTLRDFPAEVRERGANRFVADLGGDVLCRACPLYRTVQEEVEVVERMVGGDRVIERRTPAGALREAYRQVASGQWHHVERPLKSPEDLCTCRFILDHTRHEAAYEGLEPVEAEVGEAGIVAPHVPPTPVQELLQMGMGVDGFAFALQDFRAEVEALMEEMHRKNLAVYEIVARSPVEVVILCENTSTRMISPAIYERYSLGHVRDFVELMHRHGKVAVVHMCGHIRGLLSLIAQTGLDGIDALTPPPTGNTTPQEAWQVIGDHLVVHGVWDPTRWLTCPEADLERNLLATLDGLRGRPYLLCSAADGLAGIPRERFAAVARLVAQHGAPW